MYACKGVRGPVREKPRARKNAPGVFSLTPLITAKTYVSVTVLVVECALSIAAYAVYSSDEMPIYSGDEGCQGQGVAPARRPASDRPPNAFIGIYL